jgi:hypothetical protein
MLTLGGAIAGYCEIGNVATEITPTIMTRMAITHAKMGRSMKNRATVRSPERPD